VQYLVHIFIPAYGTSKYLSEAISSVLESGFRDDCKLTVVDDASATTEIKNVVDLFKSDVEYVRNEWNLGVAKNFKNCFEMSEGLLTIIMGSDDKLKHGALDELRKMFTSNPNAVFYHLGVEIIDDNSERISTVTDWIKKILTPKSDEITFIKSSSLIWRLSLGNFLYFPSIAWNMNLRDEIFWSTEYNLAVDMKLIQDLALNRFTVSFGKPVYFQYRRHENNVSEMLFKNGQRLKEEFSVNYIFFKGLKWSKHPIPKIFLLLSPLVRIHGISKAITSFKHDPRNALSIAMSCFSSIKRY